MSRQPNEALVYKVAEYCWSNKFIDIFRKYFEEHGKAFAGAPSMTNGEHNHEYFNLFNQYLQLYESTLSEHLESLDISIEEFYKDIRIIQDTSTDPYLLQFLDCLVASADYESFYKVMWKEGQKHEKFHRAEGKSSERDVSPSRGDKKGGGVELEGEAKPSRAGGAKDEGDEKDSKSSGPSEK